ETTILRDVQIIDSRRIHNLLPESAQQERHPPYQVIPSNTPFNETTRLIAEQLLRYFRILGKAFGNSIGTALSGGYDSRLMLALLRRTENTPIVYVYGSSDSSDVKVAKAIARGEGIKLEHIDKRSFPKVGPEEIGRSVERELYFFDGIKPLGLFDDGTDLATRFDRASKATLQLNGAGGEIYREIWNIGNRKTDLVTFLRMRFDRRVYSFCRNSFELSDYFEQFAAKVRRSLGFDRSWIARREAEMLFPFLRNWFAAPNNAANNQISYSLLPFMEPEFILQSFELPIHFKYCGKLEANLIKAIDPALARYNS